MLQGKSSSIVAQICWNSRRIVTVCGTDGAVERFSLQQCPGLQPTTYPNPSIQYLRGMEDVPLRGDCRHYRTLTCTTLSLFYEQVKGLQSIIAEISSPDSFYFDGTGVLRRVTSSIFDDRGNVAQREAAKKERQARFRSRQVEAEARLASLGLKV